MFLYTSWKKETDLKCNMLGKECSTYKEAYHSWKKLIDPIYDYYNGFQKDVEDALIENDEVIFDEEDSIEITATAAENANLIDEWERQERENQQFHPFLMESASFLPESEEPYDIGNEMGFHTPKDQGMVATSFNSHSKSPEEIDILYRKLNHQQQLFVSNILRRVESECESEFILLTGGPGVGKSEVLKVIDFAMDAIYSKIPGDIKCRHIKMAPTGAAACVLGRGTGTIHATLKIPVNKSINDYHPLSPNQLWDLQKKGLDQLKWVIIDEVSMVGSRMINYIDSRLRQIKGVRKKLFGGINLLVCGDLSQLSPVQDAWIFQGSGTKPTASFINIDQDCVSTKKENKLVVNEYNIWKDYCVAYELTTIMRTKNKEFAGLQHRLRELRFIKDDKKKKSMGPMKQEDIDYLNDNCIGTSNDVNYDPKALHIFLTNKKVDDHNKLVMKLLESEGSTPVRIIAKDSMPTSDLDDHTRVSLLRSAMTKNSQQTQNLEYSIDLVIGGRVSVTSNVDVQNGISNGTMGVVMHFSRAENGQVKIVWLKLDDPNIGENYRKKYIEMSRKNPQIDKSWTPIFAISRTFNIGGRGRGQKYFEIMRIQFPLTNAAARTLWKMQGATRFSTTYIDFNNRQRVQNAHVVGISRVNDPKHLKILNYFDPSLVWKCEEADAEIDRMRREANLQMLVPDLKSISHFKVVFYNMQGLKSHLEDIKSNKNLMECDLLLGAETNLKDKDSEEMCEISSQENSFTFKRFNNYKERLGRGLIVYSKQQFDVIETLQYRRSNSVLEVMVIKTNALESQLTVVNVYRSPHYPLYSLKKNMEEIMAMYSHCPNVLIMGDFNAEENVISGSDYVQMIKTSSTTGLCGGQLCHAYCRVSDYSLSSSVLFRCFTRSKHHPILVMLERK